MDSRDLTVLDSDLYSDLMRLFLLLYSHFCLMSLFRPYQQLSICCYCSDCSLSKSSDCLAHLNHLCEM